MEIKKRGRPKKINIISDIKPTYSAILILGNEREKKELKGEGKTILDALNSIPIDWEKIYSKGTIKISDGMKAAEKFFYYKPLKRIFANKVVKAMWARNFEKLLNAN